MTSSPGRDGRVPMQMMPAAFLGHGNPMNALERNRYTEAWRAFGEACGQPRGIVCVSAHWFTNASAVTAMETPRTIHDFYGFPRELSEMQYPAPGSPELAEEVASMAAPDCVSLDASSWGLDHGTWSVLVHAFPDADVPVVQLAINALQPPGWHLELGRRLAPLRERGVVVVGSGNLVHNLMRVRWQTPDDAFEWNARFDAAARKLMAEDPASAARLADLPDYRMAHPTPDHFLPLMYFAGIAAESPESAHALVEGFAYGSISMTAFALGMPAPDQSAAAAEPGAPKLPDPAVTPPEQTNL